MPRIYPLKPTFNAGIFGPRLAARVDFGKYPAACEEMDNFWPLIQGGFARRPGTRYAGAVKSAAGRVRLLPFVFDTDDAYVVEAGAGYLRFWSGRTHARVDAPNIGAAIGNGTFTADIAGWTDGSSGSASIAHDATHGRLSLVGAAGAVSVAEQTVASTTPTLEHVLRFRTYGGTIKLRVGSTSGGNEIVDDRELGPGEHVYGFTPGVSPFYVQFVNDADLLRQVDDVSLLDNAPVEIATPYAIDALRELQFAQSADVFYLAHRDHAPRKLERRGERSWSLVEVAFVDGPYRTQNTGPITLTPSAASGAITLTASAPLFRPGHVGASFRLRHSGAVKSESIAGADSFTGSIKVEGSDAERRFSVRVSGTFTATVTLQRSYDGGSTWVDVKTYTAPTATGGDAIDDGLAQTVYYRAGVKTGDYTSGTAAVSLTADGGETWGWARVTGYTSRTVVSADVMEEFAEASATPAWREGYWSDYRGFPGAVAFYQGRLWWAGSASNPQTLWGSASDDFENHAPDTDDAGPPVFTIGSAGGTRGRVDAIVALGSSQQLFAMTSGGEWAARASSLDEAISPTNIQLKLQTTRGSARLLPEIIDRAVLFVQRFGTKLFEAIYTIESEGYTAFDMTEVSEDILAGGVVEYAWQAEPSSRVFCVLGGGTVAVLTYRREQEVFAWSRFTLRAGDTIESVAVIPGAAQDEVWLATTRQVNGATRRYIEYLAPEEFGDQAEAYFVDCGVTYEGAAVAVLSGLSHLNGEAAALLVDGATHPEREVAAGSVTLQDGIEATVAHVGLPYASVWKSLRWEGGNPAGTAVGQTKRFITATTVVERSLGGEIGTDIGAMIPFHYRRVGDAMDGPPPLFSGDVRQSLDCRHGVDPRLWFRQTQPLPFTVLAVTPTTQVNPR
jgi:hypothetical protein